MSHYVVSDVHGEDDRWKAMLEKIHFSAQDTLYILGDVVDRGPHGVEILQEIMRTPNMKMLLGNHEFMCLRYFAPDATEKDIQHWNRKKKHPYAGRIFPPDPAGTGAGAGVFAQLADPF